MAGRLQESGRYQDYIIKDGQLVGEFDKAYQRFDDPWECSQSAYSLDVELFLAAVRFVSPQVGSVLDVGCGLGALTERIVGCLPPHVSATAIDVSETAIRKAKKQSSSHSTRFLVHDVLHDPWNRLPHNLDLITMCEVCWYMVPNIHTVFSGLHSLLNSGGHLLILQHFYRPEDQTYGNGVMQTASDLEGILERCGFSVTRRVDSPPKPPMKTVIWAQG